MKITVKRLALGFASAGILTIYGCGGGSSSSTTSSDVTTTTDVTTTFKGVAATGKALANATINITCAAGAEITTSKPDGSYSVDIKNITLPCALKAASSDGTTVLYSVTSATATSSNTQVANITPLTQLLVASLAGTEPAAFFSNFSASTASSVTDSAIGAAQTAVLSTMSNAGIDVSGLTSTNLVSGTLVAGSSTNAYDVALEALGAKLTDLAPTGTTLATLTTAVANTSTTTAPTSTATTSGTPSLPADMLLKTADSNCSALRSGDYWAITPVMGGNLANQYTSGSYNASSKTATNLVGGSTVFSNASTACRYNLATDSLSDIVVSQAGVMVARYRDGNGVFRLGFAIPKQSIAVSELAGTWNALGFELSDARTSYAANSFTATVSSTGAVSDVMGCNGASTTSTCGAETGTFSFSSNSAGGFDLIGSDAGGTWTDRAFAYRAGNGDLMMLEVGGNGSVAVFTKKRTLSLPTVSTVQNASWSIRTLGTLVANALAISYPATVTAVDSAAGSYTRTVNLADGKVDYSETILQNSPRAGYNFRATGSTTSVFDSRSVNIRERTSLALRGMGISVQSVPVQTGISSAGFQMSVDQP